MPFLDSTQPLGLPRGSVRALIALMFSGALTVLLVTNGTVNEVLLALAGPIVGGYFATRQAVDQTAASNQPEEVAPPYIEGEDPA